MNLEDEKRGVGVELSDDMLDGASGGVQNPAALQPPVQPLPSRPSIPQDPGLPSATPQPQTSAKTLDTGIDSNVRRG